MAATPPVSAPRIAYKNGEWSIDDAWALWATQQRATILGELLSHGTWFSKPPRREVLDPLFGPWAGRTTPGADLRFFCKMPGAPGSPKSGSAIWELQGVLMTSTSIEPVWTVVEMQEDDREDCISLFGDGQSEAASDQGTREIHLDDIESASAAGTPTRIRNREWEARKFLGKERVREARLKAQIAARMAMKEESRFIRQFGDLADGESQFSEYDLTDDERSEISDSDVDSAV